jgi:hypothetical protein
MSSISMTFSLTETILQRLIVIRLGRPTDRLLARRQQLKKHAGQPPRSETNQPE